MICPSRYGKSWFNISLFLGGLSCIIISCGMFMVPMSSNAILHSWHTSHRTRSESNAPIDIRCTAENNANNLFPNPPTGTSVKQFLLWISIFIFNIKGAISFIFPCIFRI